MAEITIDLGSRISKQNLARLRNRLKDIDPEDELTIRMEAADAHQADTVASELVRQGFDYQPRGGNGRDYYLTARKKMH